MLSLHGEYFMPVRLIPRASRNITRKVRRGSSCRRGAAPLWKLATRRVVYIAISQITPAEAHRTVAKAKIPEERGRLSRSKPRCAAPWRSELTPVYIHVRIKFNWHKETLRGLRESKRSSGNRDEWSRTNCPGCIPQVKFAIVYCIVSTHHKSRTAVFLPLPPLFLPLISSVNSGYES